VRRGCGLGKSAHAGKTPPPLSTNTQPSGGQQNPKGSQRWSVGVAGWCIRKCRVTLPYQLKGWHKCNHEQALDAANDVCRHPQGKGNQRHRHTEAHRRATMSASLALEWGGEGGNGEKTGEGGGGRGREGEGGGGRTPCLPAAHTLAHQGYPRSPSCPCCLLGQPTWSFVDKTTQSS
jgi:hypothetical protein